MKGLILGVLALTGLYLVTTTGAGKLATALAVPTGWLAKWADPSVPLISAQPGTPGTTPATTATTTANRPRLAPHPRSGPGRPSSGFNVSGKAA